LQTAATPLLIALEPSERGMAEGDSDFACRRVDVAGNESNARQRLVWSYQAEVGQSLPKRCLIVGAGHLPATPLSLSGGSAPVLRGGGFSAYSAAWYLGSIHACLGG